VNWRHHRSFQAGKTELSCADWSEPQAISSRRERSRILVTQRPLYQYHLRRFGKEAGQKFSIGVLSWHVDTSRLSAFRNDFESLQFQELTIHQSTPPKMDNTCVRCRPGLHSSGIGRGRFCDIQITDNANPASQQHRGSRTDRARSDRRQASAPVQKPFCQKSEPVCVGFAEAEANRNRHYYRRPCDSAGRDSGH
jgi:hypothetical protein